MLLEHLAGSLASAIPVSTQLDIAAQHHLFMMGRNGSNIKHIMQRTGAQIHFPDPSNPQKKSTVYLQGTIESVCLARQYLMVGLEKLLLQFFFFYLFGYSVYHWTPNSNVLFMKALWKPGQIKKFLDKRFLEA